MMERRDAVKVCGMKSKRLDNENHEYRALANQAKKYKRHGNWEKACELRKLIQRMPSKDPNDPNFKRSYYIRYADDWLIGISGNKKDAEGVKQEINTFLDTKLKLKLSETKTLITHARNEKARFLGYGTPCTSLRY